MWCETGTPDLDEARQFAEAVRAEHPGKLLAYNCSPSFNWAEALSDEEIGSFQDELSELGFKRGILRRGRPGDRRGWLEHDRAHGLDRGIAVHTWLMACGGRA